MRRIAGLALVGGLIALQACDTTSPVTPSPVDTTTSEPDTALVFLSLSVGLSHVCGVTMERAAYRWGDNIAGQLGTGDTTHSTIPVPVAGGLRFKAVSSGAYETCGITTAGALYCWGKPGYPFPPYGVDYGFRASLVPVPLFAGSTFATVSVGPAAACGVTTDGTAYCWGAAGSGELGDGTVYGGPAPARVAGGLTFAAVSPGGITCGVTTGGYAYCWGSNAFGGLGIGTDAGPEYCRADSVGTPIDPCSTVPVAVAGGLRFSQVSAMYSAACGLATGGTPYCWGSNHADGRGFGTNTGPEQCAGINGDPAGTFEDSLADACSRLPRVVPGAPALVSLSGYGDYTCGLTAAGVAYCWGHPQERGGDTSPVAVPGGLHFAMLSAGQDDTCGVTKAWVAHCWGQNLDGELGNGTMTPSDVPVKVARQR